MLSIEKNIGYLNRMKNQLKNFILTTVFFLLGIGLTFGQETETVDLTIEVNITKYNKGTIMMALYDSSDTYMKKTYKATKQKVVDNKAIIRFQNIKKGTYAFSMFHDVNGNQKMDKNFMGIPKEPYGFSNNKKGKFGPPDFDKVQFDVSNDLTLQVSIK